MSTPSGPRNRPLFFKETYNQKQNYDIFEMSNGVVMEEKWLKNLKYSGFYE